MGLDASVMCNCLRDGKTTDPPYLREWLTFDEEGELTLVAKHDTDERWHTLYGWQKSCCEHKRMEQVSTTIANWSGYRLFHQALGDLGWETFPVLQKELPHSNGGLTEAEQSKRALTELDAFMKSGVIGEKTVLINSATNEELRQRVAAYDGVFILSGSERINVELVVSEIVAKDSETGEDLFRAGRMRQFKADGTPITGDDDGIVWENLDTGERYSSGIAIGGHLIAWDDGKWQNSEGEVRQDYPGEFHVEVRPLLPENFQDIISSLKAVFSTSVETGNPVKWR